MGTRFDFPTRQISSSARTAFMANRPLSSKASPDQKEEVVEWTQPPHPETFMSPKVKELYFKLIKLERDELSLLSKVTLAEVGVDIEKEEEKRAALLEKIKAAGPVVEETVEEVVEEKTSFELKLVGFDAKAKIKVIKEVRAIAGLGLKEAKELVEGAPKVIKKDIKKEEAEELKAKLVEIGAEIEVS